MISKFESHWGIKTTFWENKLLHVNQREKKRIRIRGHTWTNSNKKKLISDKPYATLNISVASDVGGFSIIDAGAFKLGTAALIFSLHQYHNLFKKTLVY